jgi:hypothetical protein
VRRVPARALSKQKFPQRFNFAERFPSKFS